MEAGEFLSLLKKLREYISGNGSADEFAEVEEQLNNTELFLEVPEVFNDRADDEQMVNVIMVNFFDSYAHRFPDKFKEQEHCTNVFKFIYQAMIHNMLSGDKAAETLAEVIFAEQNPVYNADYLKIAVLSLNESYIDLYVSHTDKPICCFNMPLFEFLTDRGRRDIISKIFQGATRNDIIDIYHRYCYYPDQKNKGSQAEYLYELASYLPENIGKENLADAVTDLIEEMDLDISFCYSVYYITGFNTDLEDSAKRSWKFMREHGIRFRKLMFFSLNDRFYLSDEEKEKLISLLKDHVAYLLDDNSYISAYEFSNMIKDEQQLVLEHVDKVGCDKIYIDASDVLDDPNMLPYLSDKLNIMPLLKRGVDVKLSDDFRNSTFIYSLLNSNDILKILLRKGKFTGEQLNTLIDMSIENKKLEALNILRKHIEKLPQK